MFQRIIKPPKKHSFFLFGPRGVGKTTWLKTVLPQDKTYWIDLLDFDLESRLLQRPSLFQELLATLPKKIEWVGVDEVQKAPFLLNEIHRQIENNSKRHFALTGSSARKLKRGAANLLAGRAFTYSLFPLSSTELGETFRLNDALSFGTLPHLFSLQKTEDKESYLRSYAQTYLKEEIQAEGLLRSLPAFRRFLPLAAVHNGEMLSWSNFAQDVGIDATTIRTYFEILEDTLVGFLLPAYQRSLRKRQRTHPKFYFFDPGVKRALAGELSIPILPGSTEYGRAFEHFWMLEIFRHNIYHNTDFQLSYFATHDMEIDLVIEKPDKSILFVEFKSAERVKDAWLRPLQTLTTEISKSHGICICREPRKRKVGPVIVCPWQEALDEIVK